MKIIIICAGILLANSFSAQSGSTPSNDAGGNLPSILPPTPESFKFASYGNLPTGLFTGSTNINIPITSFSSEKINLLLSLNYSSNGIKVDDTNGSVGLGWRFINAGVITRVIRDMPDELNTQGNIPTPNIVALGMNDPSVTNYFALCKDDGFDSESDLYMANFNGRSLKFIIERDGTFRQLEKSDCKIQRVSGGFIIKTEDGIQYTFDATEKVRNFMTNTGQHHGGALVNTTSWYLSKVKTLQNKEINILYNDVNFTSVIGKSQSMMFTRGGQFKYGPPTTSPNGNVACPTYCELQVYTLPPSIGLVADSNQTVIGKQIKKIYDEDGNYISFEYQQQNDDFYLLKNIKKNSSSQLIENFDLDYDITANNRVFLKYIAETRSGRKYSFEYFNKEEFPNKLSFARDMWGYFNGINNSTLIPQIYETNDPQAINYNGANQSVNVLQGKYGLLSKITYPTGGSTTINYENHKIQKLVTIPAQQTSTGVETFNDRNSYLSSSQITVTPATDGPIQIGGGNSVYGEGNCVNSPILESGKQRANITVYDLNGSIIESKSYSANNGGVFTVYGQKNKPITVKASASFACSYASAHITYYISGPTQAYQDKFLGGYRVTSMVDEASGNPSITKSYDYTKSDGSYSTIQAYEPYFLDNKQEGVSSCNGSNCLPPVNYSYSTLTSTNVNQYNSSNPNIFYSRVVENLGVRGKIIHEFDTSVDEQGSIHGDMISGAPTSNTAWQSGKELSITYLDVNGNIVKKVENLYAEANMGIDENYSLATRKKYDLMGGSADNLDFVLYKNISRFSYLKNQKSTDYLNGVFLKTETEYFYNNPLHYQIAKTVTTYPDSSIEEKVFKYAREKGNTRLIDANMIGIPLETENKKNNKVTGKFETLYNNINHYFPTSILSYDLQNDISTDVTYDQYDSSGNLQQYTTRDGVPITIIWGYNSTQPIAKVVGLSYSDIQHLVSAIISASDSDASNPTTEPNLINELDVFRNAVHSLPRTDFQVTTYTYDPLIGVTSITPPSGIREVYIYDTANRLKEIRENNASGKLLKEFKYHYKN